MGKAPEISEHIRPRLEYHRRNFEEIAGRSFEHFYCPILHVDEPADLQKGHVINEAFKGAPGFWVVQRRDVDSFFGKHFEADFGAFVYAFDKPPEDSIHDKNIYTHFRPKIMRGDERINYFIFENFIVGDETDEAGRRIIIPDEGKIPKGHQFIEFWNSDNTAFKLLCVKMPADYMRNPDLTKPFVWDYTRDFRVPAFATLIKAAHLSMFWLFGYRYALSDAGRFVGDYILGRFFRENRSKKRAEVQAAALAYFHEFRHMIRPMNSASLTVDGTAIGGEVAMCCTEEEGLWAMIVFVRTGDIGNAVILPAPDNEGALAKFQAFLADDNDTPLVIRDGKYEKDNARWVASTQTKEIRWPKSADSYPHDSN